jgi:predicted XRE-type DNA-binding protein
VTNDSEGFWSSSSFFPDADVRQVKLRLAYCLTESFENRKLSDASAAKVLGVSLASVRAIRSYRLRAFSIERLMTLVMALGRQLDRLIDHHEVMLLGQSRTGRALMQLSVEAAQTPDREPGRAMPSVFIRDASVVGLIPSRAAAPSRP